MRGQQVVRGIALAVAGVAFCSGCTGNPKQRLSMLEQANQSLTERLNRAQAERDDARQRYEDCNRRLSAAQGEMNALSSRLAEKPVEEAAPGWTPVPGGAMIAIEGSVLFAPGKIALRNEARRTLDAIVSTVEGQYAEKDVMVFGHTDDQPIKKSGWTDNYQLSTERSLAVVRYLKEHSVAPSRLVACGCGEHRPRSANSSEASRASNRRVEIYAIDRDMIGGRR